MSIIRLFNKKEVKMQKPQQDTIIVNGRLIAVVKMPVKDKSMTRRVSIMSACATQSGACMFYKAEVKK